MRIRGMCFKKITHPFCILLIFFILLGMAGYSNIINSFFISDDFALINKVIKYGPFGIFPHPESKFLRPLVSLSFFFDYKLWALNSTGYHLSNIIIHSINSFLVFLVSFLLLGKTLNSKKQNDNLVISLFSGFVFLLLPCHTETVSWISGRGDVIATFFGLLSFLTYLFYKKYSNLSYLLISFLLYSLAIFSKESIIIYPFIILFYELYSYFIEGNKKYKLIRNLFPTLIYIPFLILYLLIRYLTFGEIVSGYGKNIHLNFNTLSFFNNFLTYTARIFLPSTQNIKSIFITIIALTVTSAVIIKFIKKIKITPILHFLIGAYCISLAPVINIMGDWIGDSQGERFIYFPSVFLVIFGTFLLYLLIGHKKYFVITICLLILFLGFSLYINNKSWVVAGEISQDILNSIKAVEKPGMVFIINIPDNINGAYIYRNGLKDAIDIFIGHSKSKKYNIFSSHDIYNKNDVVKITKNSNVYDVQLLNSRVCFKHVAVYFGKVINIACNNYSLELEAPNINNKLLFYSAGKMEELKF